MLSCNLIFLNEFQHSNQYGVGVQFGITGHAPNWTTVSFIGEAAAAESFKFNCVGKNGKPSYSAVP
jgi:hypothetical protein